MKELFNIETIICRQWSGVRNGWMDKETCTQQEVNRFYDSDIYEKFIETNRNIPSKINKQLTYGMIEDIYKWGKGTEALNFLAFNGFMKAYKGLISKEVQK